MADKMVSGVKRLGVVCAAVLAVAVAPVSAFAQQGYNLNSHIHQNGGGGSPAGNFSHGGGGGGGFQHGGGGGGFQHGGGGGQHAGGWHGGGERHGGGWGPAVGLGLLGAGLAAGAIGAGAYGYGYDNGDDDCYRYRPTYDAYGNYMGRRLVNVCDQ